MKITSRHMSTNGEVILKTMLSWIKLFRNRTWSYHSHYDLEECSAVIIDVDNEEGKQLWSELDTIHPSSIKIPYSSASEKYSENPFFFRKPVNFSQLKQLIETISSSIDKPPNEITIDQTVQQAEHRSSTVLEAIVNNEAKNIRIDTKSETVLIDKNRLLFSGFLSDEEMKDLLLSDSSSCKISLSEDNARIENFSRDFSEPLVKTVSQQFNGQLIPPLSHQYYYKLIRWPNFKRNRYHPAYVKIAVALNNKFYDIASVSQLCRVSFEEIATFINICYVLQNLEMKKNQPSPALLPSVDQKRKGTSAFLGKIRSRLGI